MSTIPSNAEAAVSAEAPAAPSRKLGVALGVIATTQLMIVLDAQVVYVALPKIQDALHFSGTNLEWVVNAYTLAFGGLLLLGGRLGDLLGRRRIFLTGILLFTLASLAGGLATNEAWLITARGLQGVGAALAAPTALSLIAVNFPPGAPRNKAIGVYAGMNLAGGAIGLIVGGLLVVYADWRWVLFVNVPIGLVVAFLTPRVLQESERRRGEFDLPGAITGSLGVASLVYALSSGATTPDGISHWGDPKVVVALVAAVVLLIAFAIIEARTENPLLPPRVLRSRDRSGAYLIMLFTSTAMFGMFFFLTIFMQDVWNFSALRTGLAYLPMLGGLLIGAGLATQLVQKVGARPLMIVGSAMAAGGMFWLSRIAEHSTYAGSVLGPTMVIAAGVGTVWVPLGLLALVKVDNRDSGVAASLLEVGQPIGGSIGLALLGAVAWSAVASNLKSQTAALTGTPTAAARAAMTNHAFVYGFSKGFILAAAFALLVLVLTLLVIRGKREDLAGINPHTARVDAAA